MIAGSFTYARTQNPNVVCDSLSVHAQRCCCLLPFAFCLSFVPIALSDAFSLWVFCVRHARHRFHIGQYAYTRRHNALATVVATTLTNTMLDLQLACLYVRLLMQVSPKLLTCC